MECARTGELRAFLDDELSGSETAALEAHLVSCASCRAELEALRENALVARSAMDLLAPVPSKLLAANWSQIRARTEGRARGPVTVVSEVSRMMRGLLSFAGGSRLRLAASAVVALVAVSLLFTLSPVQTAASGFLSLFRVKQFVAVTVDPSSLPNLAAPKDLGSLNFIGDRQPKSVSTLAEASKAVGFTVPIPTTLPAGLESTPRSLMVTGAFSATFTPDIKKVRAYLSSIGASDVKLPDNLDGAPISLQVSPAVSVLYTEKGGVSRSPDGTVRPQVGQRFLYLGATTSPTLNVPDGIDVEQIRTELLKVPGLPPELVNQLRAVQDWRNTVVVPVVKGTSKDVTVQGEKGLLISASDGQGETLLWLKGNVVYTMTGNVSEAELLAAANSLH